jgi:uncharacterized membrane protein YkvA (DUF1232 family)
MSAKNPSKQYGINDQLQFILQQNPFLLKENDEVERYKIINWIESYINENEKIERYSERDLLSLLSKLVNDGVLFECLHNNQIFLGATSRYISLKNGLLFVEYDGKNYLIIDKNDKSQLCPNTNNQRIKRINFQNNLTFYEWYISSFNSSQNIDNPLTKHLPQFLNLLCNLLTHKDTDVKIKILCSLALSYLVIEDDYYPDSQPNGYLDDMFIITYALKQVMDKNPDILKKNWAFNEDILILIYNLYDELHKIVEKDMYRILMVVGMDQYSLYNIETIKNCISK